MSGNQQPPPRLPEAPTEYSQQYMSDLVRALELFIAQERNPGEIRVKSLNLSSVTTAQKTFSEHVTSITVANGQTTGKETAVSIPSNFIPMGVTISVTGAASNAVNLNDIGTDADTDGFVDGISVAVNSVGFKGFFPCNGVLGMSGGATTASTETADEVELVLSADPGADTTITLKFIGVSSSSDLT